MLRVHGLHFDDRKRPYISVRERESAYIKLIRMRWHFVNYWANQVEDAHTLWLRFHASEYTRKTCMCASKDVDEMLKAVLLFYYYY